METYKRVIGEATGWLVFLSLLMLLALLVPPTVFDAESKDFLLLIGAVGIWRYSMGGLHFLRGMLFLYLVYPHYRRKVRKLGDAADPSHVYLMVTSFRIDALTTSMVYRSVIEEAIACGYPTTVVCSIVEMSDEVLIKQQCRSSTRRTTSSSTSCVSPAPASATAWPMASVPSPATCRMNTRWSR